MEPQAALKSAVNKIYDDRANALSAQTRLPSPKTDPNLLVPPSQSHSSRQRSPSRSFEQSRTASSSSISLHSDIDLTAAPIAPTKSIRSNGNRKGHRHSHSSPSNMPNSKDDSTVTSGLVAPKAPPMHYEPGIANEGLIERPTKKQNRFQQYIHKIF